MAKPKYEITVTEADGSPYIPEPMKSLGDTEPTKFAVYSDAQLAQHTKSVTDGGGTIHVRKL